MAEHTHSGPVELGAPMDYREHERTYDGFIALTKLTIVATIDIMIALALFAFGTGGFWLGVILTLLTLIGLGIALAAKGSVKPLIGVTIIGLLFFVLSIG